MRKTAMALTLALAAALCGCSRDSDPGPGGVTKGEARELDEAADIIEARPAPPLVDATVPADLAAPEGTASAAD